MAKEEKAPVIIIKRKKKGGGGHHGGAWKVAYADFVTAMMAFFLVMWLVSSISKEQRAAMFDYFKNPSMEPGKSIHAAPGQMGPGGASTSVINMGGGMDAPRVIIKDSVPNDSKSKPQPFNLTQTAAATATDPDTARQIADEADHKKLESLLEELRKAIDKSQALKPFKDQLLLDITPEGLRIQIVDQQNRPMFDLGSARLKDYTSEILKTLSGYLNTVPNRISLTGHTDIRPYPGGGNYTNWELSADRANAARRALESGGLAPEKIARVVGLSSSVLFDKDNPQNPINRRISIIVMTKAAEDSALRTETRPETPVPPPALPTGVTAATDPAPAAPATPEPHASAVVPVPAAAHTPAAATAMPDNIQPVAPPPIRGTAAPVAPAEGAPG
jgi:chemotaxis protein MotB